MPHAKRKKIRQKRVRHVIVKRDGTMTTKSGRKLKWDEILANAKFTHVK